MSSEKLIPVHLPAGVNNCFHEDVACVGHKGANEYCRRIRTEFGPNKNCTGIIFLTPEEVEQHQTKIITWRLKS